MQERLDQQRELAQQQAQEFIDAINRACKNVKIAPNDDNGNAVPASAVATGAMDGLRTKSAMDSADNGVPYFKEVALQAGQQNLALMPWFVKQGFIGYQNAAFIAQHWLIYKGCATPVDDAIRNGYDVTTADGEDLDDKALKMIKRADRKFGIMGQLRDFGIKGRIFGVRIAMFNVDSDDPDYYEKPFNPDSVKPGKYKGISQIDPYWTAPILDMESSGVPSSKHFYEPTWWLIGSKRVHRTHLVIFRYMDPPDVLKPLYLFGGIPLPQMIMERVYCAERTANEAPALALTKRTTVWKTNMEAIMADTQKADQELGYWIQTRDNFGIKLGDKQEDEFEQFDTSLSEFDSLIMTQYGLVAATVGAPITKLLGTTPGGFAATGDYDASSYHELLESMQERDFTPLLERHHQLVMLSEVIPKFKKLKDAEIVVKWHEVDALSHKELAELNLTKAQTDAALIAAGEVSPEDGRARVAKDRDSGYHGIGIDLEDEELPDEDDPEAAAAAARGGNRAPAAAVEAEGRGKKKPLKKSARVEPAEDDEDGDE
jgi:hypothetical protein